MNAPAELKLPEQIAGYRTFTLGEFTFQRDEYFVTVTWPAKGQRQSHTMSADAFLRAIMRDVAWGFFYGLVNFDTVFGTRNLYGRVELFAGRYNESIHKAGLSYVEVFDSPVAMKRFKEIPSCLAMNAPASTAGANIVAVSRLAFDTPTVSTRRAISGGVYASRLKTWSVIVHSSPQGPQDIRPP